MSLFSCNAIQHVRKVHWQLPSVVPLTRVPVQPCVEPHANNSEHISYVYQREIEASSEQKTVHGNHRKQCAINVNNPMKQSRTNMLLKEKSMMLNKQQHEKILKYTIESQVGKMTRSMMKEMRKGKAKQTKFIRSMKRDYHLHTKYVIEVCKDVLRRAELVQELNKGFKDKKKNLMKTKENFLITMANDAEQRNAETKEWQDRISDIKIMIEIGEQRQINLAKKSQENLMLKKNIEALLYSMVTHIEEQLMNTQTVVILHADETLTPIQTPSSEVKLKTETPTKESSKRQNASANKKRSTTQTTLNSSRTSVSTTTPSSTTTPKSQKHRLESTISNEANSSRRQPVVPKGTTRKNERRITRAKKKVASHKTNESVATSSVENLDERREQIESLRRTQQNKNQILSSSVDKMHSECCAARKKVEKKQNSLKKFSQIAIKQLMKIENYEAETQEILSVKHEQALERENLEKQTFARQVKREMQREFTQTAIDIESLVTTFQHANERISGALSCPDCGKISLEHNFNFNTKKYSCSHCFSVNAESLQPMLETALCNQDINDASNEPSSSPLTTCFCLENFISKISVFKVQVQRLMRLSSRAMLVVNGSEHTDDNTECEGTK